MNYRTQQIVLYALKKYLELLDSVVEVASKEDQEEECISSFYKDFLTSSELQQITNHVLYQHGAKREKTLPKFDRHTMFQIIGRDQQLLQYYIAQWEGELYEQQFISKSQIDALTQQIGHVTHYLKDKLVSDWDVYDYTNYKSLCLKSGKFQRVYGVFCISVSQCHIDKDIDNEFGEVMYYNTYSQAQEKLQELLEKRQQKYAEVAENTSEIPFHILQNLKPI